MKNKRILSLLLSIIMILGMAVVPAFAQDDAVTVYFNASKYGEFVTDKSGNSAVFAPVVLGNSGLYTLSDAIEAFHDEYYVGGSKEGYAYADSELYGRSLTKFWGVEGYNFGYMINTEMAISLSENVEDGDYIDVTVNQSSYPDNEAYSHFDSFKKESYVGQNVTLALKSVSGYDEYYNYVYSPCEGATITVDGVETEIVTDSKGCATLNFDSEGTYIVSAKKSKIVKDNTVTAIAPPACAVTVKALPDTYITVPSNAQIKLTQHNTKSFVRMPEIKSVCTVLDGDNKKYYFDLSDNTEYQYRVSGEDYLTYVGFFKKTADFNLSVSNEMLTLSGKNKTTVDRDGSSNGGQNVADIFLNINPQGYLKLAKNSTYQLVTLRNWEIINNTSNKYIVEPDYHFSVIDENGRSSDIVEIDESGLLTAKASGTAIVLVTYDAVLADFGSGASFYGAIYPENTGVFVVSVDSVDSGIETGMAINKGKNNQSDNENGNQNILKVSGDMIDAEHDCIYYAGETGKYTFTPVTEDVRVYVANPTVGTSVSYNGFEELSKNDDGSFDVPLKHGRNIVKLEKDGKAEYQIITAKKVTITVNGDEAVHPGDELTIVVDKLYHPANKIAGTYNMFATPLYTTVSGYDDKIVGGITAQYTFASAPQNIVSLAEGDYFGLKKYTQLEKLTVPSDYKYDTFKISDGVLYANGWGDSYGRHREISYETGKGANLNAATKIAYFGSLPDIEIPIVATSSEISSISLATEGVGTNYYVGEKFDTSSLVVTAKYQDGTEQLATNYTVSPSVLDANTEKVTITYRGKTAEIPVTVTVPKVVSIEITHSPEKTVYSAGEVFNPSGMVVTATYENSKIAPVKDYTYSPNRPLEVGDSAMTITYNGSDADENLLSVTQPITVNASQSGSEGTTSDNKIKVYFTLLGDSKHGAPKGNSDTHTYKGGNLKTWISKTELKLPKNSCVIDAVKYALGVKGIPYTNVGNYISDIKGLAEFDNGDSSGWMYTHNGVYTNLGVEEQTLSDGDSIVLHYTDDYTLEKTSYSGNSPSSSSKNEKKDEEHVKKDEEKPVFDKNTYSDVKESDWYYEAVKYAFENSLMNGTENGFEPESTMTRSMLVTVLWRLAEKPDVEVKDSFDDVEEGSWYYDAVRWAASENIISGLDEKTFGSDDEITREQLAVILYRYAQKYKLDIKLNNKGNVEDFDDYNLASDYAKEALKWAFEAGIIKGNGNNTICPSAFSTRAEIAVMLMRFCEGISE